MCTYNGATHIDEQLRSIACQRVLPLELIVCDDGSTDSSLRILRNFEKTAAFRVEVIVNATNLGPAANFEQAIRACSGDIIALSDQDDIWAEDKTGKIVDAFNSNPKAGYAFSDGILINDDGTLRHQTLWNRAGVGRRMKQHCGAAQFEVLLKENVITGASMALRASLRENLLPFPAGWMHDYWIAAMGSATGYGVPVSEALFSYRIHPSQVCSLDRSNTMELVKWSLATNQEDLVEKLAAVRVLRDRLRAFADLSATSRVFSILDEKERHLERRIRIRSTQGCARASDVFHEALSGRYHRFSRSWKSIVRDFIGARPSRFKSVTLQK
jgi:glycosyltransferase involved in cell wall biosynthesis